MGRNMAAAHLLYPLKLQVIDFQENEQEYHFHAEAPDPRYCEACGTVGELVRFGKQDQSYRDVPIHGKRSTIWIVRRRYKCRECGNTFRPTMHDMSEKHQMTRRLVEYVEKSILHRTNSDVAREVGIEEKTVRRIFQSYRATQESALKIATPKWLGIDELYLSRAYRCVFTNLKENTVIDMLPSRNKAAVSGFLQRLPDRKNIEVVCIDMHAPYRDASRDVLHHADIVVDKFHITRMANEAMDAVRKNVKGTLKRGYKNTLKYDRKLLLSRAHDLQPMQQLVVDTWCNAFPELRMSYKLKEGFYDIWEAKDSKEAIMLYNAWKLCIPDAQAGYWKPLTTAVANWGNEIFSYFDLGKQITNAFTESNNRRIRDRHRDARGLSFDVCRAKILFAQQHKIQQPKPQKSSPFASRNLEGDGLELLTTSRAFYDSFFQPPEPQKIDLGVPISTVMGLLEKGELD